MKRVGRVRGFFLCVSFRGFHQFSTPSPSDDSNERTAGNNTSSSRGSSTSSDAQHNDPFSTYSSGGRRGFDSAEYTRGRADGQTEDEAYAEEQRWAGTLRNFSKHKVKNPRLFAIDMMERQGRRMGLTRSDESVGMSDGGVTMENATRLERQLWRSAIPPQHADDFSFPPPGVKETPNELRARLEKDLLKPLHRRVEGCTNYNGAAFMQIIMQIRVMLSQYERELKGYELPEGVHPKPGMKGLWTEEDEEFVTGVRDRVREIEWKYELI